MAIYGLLGISIWTCLAVAPDKARAIIGILQIALLILFFLAFRYMVRLWGSRFVSANWSALGIGVLLYLGLWAATLAYRWPPVDDWAGVAVPGMANVRSVGFLSLAAFCSGAALAVNSQSRSHVVLAFILLTVGAWGSALWTGSRGAAVAMTVVAMVVIALAKGSRLRISGLIFGSLVAAILLVYPIPYGSPDYGLGNFFWGSQSNDPDSFSSGRTTIWKATFEMAKVHPIFGLGLDQFQFNGPEISRGVKQPHNWPLQILFSSGLAGVLLVPIALIPLVNWKTSVLLDRKNLPSILCLTGMLVFAGYDAPGYYLYPLTLVAIALASVSPPPARDRSG
ncbi:O-antigen ligase family protein [Sphingorhabdus pulchriflava]|nr:O-antigen ligase family protein [Sphingorhabdus pulchriflava]